MESDIDIFYRDAVKDKEDFDDFNKYEYDELESLLDYTADDCEGGYFTDKISGDYNNVPEGGQFIWDTDYKKIINDFFINNYIADLEVIKNTIFYPGVNIEDYKNELKDIFIDDVIPYSENYFYNKAEDACRANTYGY